MSRKQHHAHAKHLYVRTNSWAEALKGLTMTDKYPGYTRHGHPIPGADGINGQRPKYIARCGGPAICGTCSLDAVRYNAPRPDGNEPPTMTDQPNTEDVLDAHDRETAAKEDMEKFKNQIAKEAVTNFAKSLDEWDGDRSESFKDGVEFAATLGYRFAEKYG